MDPKYFKISLLESNSENFLCLKTVIFRPSILFNYSLSELDKFLAKREDPITFTYFKTTFNRYIHT